MLVEGYTCGLLIQQIPLDTGLRQLLAGKPRAFSLSAVRFAQIASIVCMAAIVSRCITP